MTAVTTSQLEATWQDAGSSLGSLEEDWRRLEHLDSRATLYQTWEWNAAWWSCFKRRKRARILVIREGGRIIAIAPFYTSRHLGLPVRRLAFFGTGVSDYLDILAADRHRDMAARLVLETLSRSSGFELADLQQLRPGAALLIAARSWDCPCEVLPQEPCPYLPLEPAWERQIAAFNKKLRQNIGYHERLIERTFSDHSWTLCTEESLEVGMTALFALHQSRWKARLLPGVLGSVRTQRFHRIIARQFARLGSLRLHLLRLEESPAAALYCFCFKGRTYYYLGGFDPQWSKYSLGTILTARAIRQAIEDGCDVFDFLRGAEPYKYRWTSAEELNSRLLLAPSAGVGSQTLRAIISLERVVEHRAKDFAERRGRGKRKK